MKPVVLLEQASDDLQAAKEFYDRIEPGVGDYCVDSLIADLQRLGLFHGIHSLHFGCH